MFSKNKGEIYIKQKLAHHSIKQYGRHVYIHVKAANLALANILPTHCSNTAALACSSQWFIISTSSQH